jgi:hypothetical protein
MLRQEDGVLKPGATDNIFSKLVDTDSLVWHKQVNSEEEAIVEKARLALLSNEEKETFLPWYSPSPEFRKANVLLTQYFKVTPPVINGMNMQEYKEWLTTLHTAVRGPLVRKYSWAIPTEEAVRRIIDHGPIVEMGAGTGYWAYLIRILNGDVIAYDVTPPSNESSLEDWNIWHAGNTFTEVLEGGPGVLKQYSDRTLFLCWPPLKSPMASECLRYWKGKKLIFIGDRDNTANKGFFKYLKDDFSLTEVVPIPQWANARDAMTIWRRLD